VAFGTTRDDAQAACRIDLFGDAFLVGNDNATPWAALALKARARTWEILEE